MALGYIYKKIMSLLLHCNTKFISDTLGYTRICAFQNVEWIHSTICIFLIIFLFITYDKCVIIHSRREVHSEIHCSTNPCTFCFVFSMWRYNKEKRISRHNETRSNETFFFPHQIQQAQVSARSTLIGVCLTYLYLFLSFPLIIVLCYTKFSTLAVLILLFSFIPFSRF